MPIRLIKTCNKVKVVRLRPNMMMPRHSVFSVFDWNSCPRHQDAWTVVR
jgi:hypothetical protein